LGFTGDTGSHSLSVCYISLVWWLRGYRKQTGNMNLYPLLYVIGTPDHMIAGYYMLLVLQITWLQDIICYWYSRSHDCRILYVIGTPDHMIVGYYMLFWIFQLTKSFIASDWCAEKGKKWY
jgi:hypothetical protein